MLLDNARQSQARHSGAATRLPLRSSCAALANTCHLKSTCPNSCGSTRRTVLRGWSVWASRSGSSTSSHLSAPARSRGRWTLFHASFSTSHLQRDPVGTWVSIARSDLKRCSRKMLLTLKLVHSIRETRSGRAYPLPLGRPDAETGGGQGVRAACNGCARSAYLRHQHVPDVPSAQALPRAGNVGASFPRRSSVACMLTCMQCMYMFITFSCLVYNVY